MIARRCLLALLGGACCMPGRAADAMGGATRLVALKAVSAGYPLRGVMRTFVSRISCTAAH